MILGDSGAVIFSRPLCNTRERGHKAPRPEYLVADLPQVGGLVVVDGAEDGPVAGKQVSQQQQSRVDHRAPIGMEAAVGGGVLHQPATLLIVVGPGTREVVVVEEVVARVVGRVDVDELDLAGVGGTQELEGIQIVSLDVEVAGRVPAHGPPGLGPHVWSMGV